MTDEQGLLTRHAEYIESSTGSYWLKDVYAHLGLTDESSKATIRQQSHRFLIKGIITRVGKEDGHYRRVDKEAKPIDIINAVPGLIIDVKYPFGLHNVIKTQQKELVVIAGATGAGKSAYLLNFCLDNLEKHEVNLFTNTEMTASAIKERLLDHPNIGGFNMSNMHAFERESDFADIIRPDGINVIDYLEVSSERPSKVGDDLAAILNSLNTGMALVAIQKRTNQQDAKGKIWEVDLGVGGEWSKRKAGIYLTLDHYPDNMLTIRKCRGRVLRDVNPIGMAWKFKLVNGISFIQIHQPDDIKPKQTGIGF